MWRSVALLLLFTTTQALAQTTSSTMCQATEVVIDATFSERRLVGCGEGFPDNLLWHLDRADSIDGTLDGKVTRRLTGRGAVIYVIDTGVLAAHHEFTRAAGSNVSAGLDANGRNDSAMAPTWFPFSPATLLLGHGTGVASVAAGVRTGVAPDASIVAVMNSDSASVYRRTLLEIIEHAFAPTTPSFRTAVINASGGLPAGSASAPELDALIRRMTTGVNVHGEDDPAGKRFLFVAAAGNLYRDQPFNQCGANDAVVLYPASLGRSVDGVVSVGGIDRDNRYWSGACEGDGVEVAAPASPNLLVASISSNDAYRYKPAAQAEGTSWSAPYVSGMAALLLEENPSRTPAELEALLKASPSRVEGIPVPVMAAQQERPAAGPKRRSVRR